MQVIGAVFAVLLGVGLGIFLIWLISLPFRAAGHVSRSVKAADIRNRETIVGTVQQQPEDPRDIRRELRAARQRDREAAWKAQFKANDDA